ncbi:metallophosphoesterase family protein [Cytobacillus purgationiresistens]|uniref:Phosphoesterase n=1 Tax=Cytobacillus purgationiresistens TaxID=863449 RepID=A0ABU0AI61_9BACI|nr:metallophosphoesterase family protein [Cytobacillus purgationiresistens]MDQ0270943.1 putative phosphoesterase [Cytobacillus purgationiresistens]
MKIAFISDIHGNAAALEAVLEDINQRQVDEIAVLGDISFRGLEPKKSLKIVQSLNCRVIKGNADEWVVRGIRQGEVPEYALENMTIERDWTYRHLEEGDIAYLNSLPETIDMNLNGIDIHAFHATPDSLFEVVMPYEEDETLINKLMVKDASVYVYGHIHKPYIRFIDNKCVVNIGSVGLPFDGATQSSYGLIEVKEQAYQVSIIRVSYDVEQELNRLDKSDYPNRDFLSKTLFNGKV